jgi:hypothetical protein
MPRRLLRCAAKDQQILTANGKQGFSEAIGASDVHVKQAWMVDNFMWRKSLQRYTHLNLTDFLILCTLLLLLRNEPLCLERSHAPTSCTSDSLSIPLILHVASSKYALDARLRRSRDSDDISIEVRLQLRAYEGRSWLMSDRIEESAHG